MKVEAVHKFHAKIPDQVLGRHLWIYTGMWSVSDPADDRVLLDVENLITIDGPGCYWCEEKYTKKLAATPCRGHGI